MLSGNFFFVFHDAGWPAPGPHHAHAMTAASVNFQLFWQALSAKSSKITPPGSHAMRALAFFVRETIIRQTVKFTSSVVVNLQV